MELVTPWHPQGDRRMSANPRVNGGALSVPSLSDFRDYAVDV